MSFDRVIQDSDDEDDPLLEERPPRDPPPIVHQNDNRASYRDTSNDPLNEDSSRQLAVNFDQFLSSQDAGQVGPTSSQQQREERWIPNNAGGGSIGTMMNEIGLAQQRLFDDEDAQHGWARSGLPDGYDTTNGYDDGYFAPQQPEIQIQSTTPPGSYVSLPPPYGPNHEYTGNPDTDHQAPTPINHSIDFSGYEHTHSATTSYNIFESSLRPSESTYSENNTTLKSHQSIPTEAVQRSPRRWNSTQGTISSPHDTEPNSSILAAQASRSKSDNNASSNRVQQPATSVDELALPVEAEAPAVGKKRGRPKKQSLPDVDGDNGLAQPAEQQAAEQPPVTEKRKPGRPPKNAKNPEAYANAANPGQSDDVPSLAEDPKTNEVPEQMSDTFQFRVPSRHNPAESTPTDSPKTKKPKEPAKKKLKRGKTTSVTLQKTYESDVEDDVIWVESRPSNADAATPEETNTAPFSINIEAPAPPKTEETTETKQPDPAAAEPAPKKRGRKRKKTSEQAPAPAPQAEPEPEESPEQSNPNLLDTLLNTHPHADPEGHTASTEPQSPKDPEPEPEPGPEPEYEKPPVTPQKPDPKTPSTGGGGKPSTKGPDKHSPISSTSKVPYRVGLSRRARIAPLLKIVKR